MKIADLLGKAQNFIGKAKSKQTEIKTFIDGLKNQNQDNNVSNLSNITRSADVTPVIQEDSSKSNYLIYGLVGVVVIYMLMKKKKKKKYGNN